MKNALKKVGGGGSGRERGGGGGVGQGCVERRIEVVMEMPKKVWEVRVGVNEELKLL